VGLNPEARKSEQRMPAIRRCLDIEHPALLRIINLAAKKYQGVIPADRWHEPYMDADELTAEIAAGVEFWGAERDAALVGVMGVQEVLDVDLIRHAYVLPAYQGEGIGGDLLTELCSRRSRPILVGTWAAASWAIDFYKRHGFGVVQPKEAKALLKKYWTIPDRQIETSVVLRRK
jgi:GNAT superfamily N-acetyltransferase